MSSCFSLQTLSEAVLSKWAFFALVAVVAVCAAAVYVSKYYIMPSLDPAYAENNEFTQGSAAENKPAADFTLYYATWCPHSKAAQKVWEPFAAGNEGKVFGTSTVAFSSVDCEEEPDSADAAGVTEYPTMILSKGKEKWYFDAKPTPEALTAFLEKSLA